MSQTRVYFLATVDRDGLPHSVLDLSFNLLKAIPDTLEHLTALKTVYFVQNRISTISGLQGLGATLRSLELGGNKLRVNADPLLSHAIDYDLLFDSKSRTWMHS